MVFCVVDKFLMGCDPRARALPRAWAAEWTGAQQSPCQRTRGEWPLVRPRKVVDAPWAHNQVPDQP
eukprot:14183173-Alexandrium_andersonii.AAC.1